jgi:hypothetical protein
VLLVLNSINIAYKPLIAYKAKRKNNIPANIIYTNILAKNYIQKAIIYVYIKVYLIIIKPSKHCLLIRSKYINNILLKETRTIK